MQPRQHAPAPFEAREADDSDLQALVAMRAEYSPKLLEHRIRNRQECFLMSVGGIPVSSCWFSRGEAHIGGLGLTFPLRQGEVYAYDTYVDPKHRHKGINAASIVHFDHRYWPRGIRTVLGCATLGRRPYGKGHPDSVATIRTLRLGPLRKFWVRTYGPQADCWRERLKELRWA